MLKLITNDQWMLRISLIDNQFNTASGYYKGRRNKESSFIHHEGKWAS